MTQDPVAASNGVPPRRVFEGTRVDGHRVQVSDTRPGFCECGARQPSHWDVSSSQWREEHLSVAWPVLVPRQESEPLDDWLNRISEVHVDAAQAELRLFEQLRMRRSIPTGGKLHVITDEYAAAAARVEVLAHQASDVRATILREYE